VTPTPPLYGLVLAGGRSSRMGMDKGLLDYRGKPHRDYLLDVLRPHCDRVVLSLNAAQPGADRPDVLVDNPRYEPTPIGALLTAHGAHPGCSWLVVSCDLAYFDPNAAAALMTHRDPQQAGTAFVIDELGQPEPLLTIYESAFVSTLPATYAAGERSLRRALHRAGCVLIHEYDRRWAESVDTIEGHQLARRRLTESP
jgi:molybdenum cofactor guanylyltransferase